MAMQIFSTDAKDWAHIERLVRQKGYAGFEKRKFHENVHSPRQRGGKLEGGKEDGMGSGGKVRMGCKPAAVRDPPIVVDTAKTTMHRARLKRGDESLTHAGQAGARRDKDSARKYVDAMDWAHI